MNSREKFEFYKEVGNFKQTAEDCVIRLVNDLIESLYVPVKGERMNKVDNSRVKRFKIDRSEPINWGDLKCNEVKKFEDGSFLVVIDEASPSDCPTFCEYIKTYMKSYGWDCKVETEW
jgi:hypothetical protein